MAIDRYLGGCQCGAVRYEATVDVDEAIACNCSRCGKTGLMFAFTPGSRFELLSGDESLREFRFASETIRHLFCDHCGVESFARGQMPDGTAMAAINVRCLDGIDVFDLKPSKYRGADA